MILLKQSAFALVWSLVSVTSLSAHSQAVGEEVIVTNSVTNPVNVRMRQTARVTVSNSDPISVVEDFREIVRIAEQGVIRPHETQAPCGDEPAFTVPAGKLLIVEHSSVRATLGVTLILSLELVAVSAASSHEVTLPYGTLTPGGTVFASSTPVTFYALEGETVFTRITRGAQGSTGGPDIDVRCSITGRLVNAS
jgi:hypothetical protein